MVKLILDTGTEKFLVSFAWGNWNVTSLTSNKKAKWLKLKDTNQGLLFQVKME